MKYLFALIILLSFNQDDTNNVKLELKLSNGKFCYTFENNTSQNYYFVDFIVNQSYFFYWKIEEKDNVCFVSAKNIKLDYNSLRKKFKVKLPRNSNVSRVLVLPEKGKYDFILCDTNKIVNLTLCYSPGMGKPLPKMEKKYKFIDFVLCSNTLKLTYNDLKKLKRN